MVAMNNPRELQRQGEHRHKKTAIAVMMTADNMQARQAATQDLQK